MAVCSKLETGGWSQKRVTIAAISAVSLLFFSLTTRTRATLVIRVRLASHGLLREYRMCQTRNYALHWL